MKLIPVQDAVQNGWRIFQFDFTDGSSELIASLITTGAVSETVTRLIKNDFLTEYIDDEISNFSYEFFFSRKIDGLIEDVTKQYINN